MIRNKVQIALETGWELRRQYTKVPPPPVVISTKKRGGGSKAAAPSPTPSRTGDYFLGPARKVSPAESIRSFPVLWPTPLM